MIITFLPNPALDKTLIVSNFRLGQIHRPSQVLTLAGGKGFNFARSLKNLGYETLVVTSLAALLGQYLMELAANDGLTSDFQPVEGTVRTCLTILDPENENLLTELYEKGSALKNNEWSLLFERTVNHFDNAEYLVICGSFPPDVPESGLVDMLQRASRAGVKIMVDTSGKQLTEILKTSPEILKINQSEAVEMLRQQITTPDEALQAAKLLQERGAKQVVITLGKQGAVGVTSLGDTFTWVAPEVKALSTVGSGDAFLAGIVMGLKQGYDLKEATKWGIAAGAANTLQIGAGRFEREQVDQFLPIASISN